jgi:hypothetical protein
MRHVHTDHFVVSLLVMTSGIHNYKFVKEKKLQSPHPERAMDGTRYQEHAANRDVGSMRVLAVVWRRYFT